VFISLTINIFYEDIFVSLVFASQKGECYSNIYYNIQVQIQFILMEIAHRCDPSRCTYKKYYTIMRIMFTYKMYNIWYGFIL